MQNKPQGGSAEYIEGNYYIFTDGACSGNPGPGGWGAVIVGEDKYIETGGGDPKTTNNRMEMTAAVEALKLAPGGCRVFIITDSSYTINGITKWIRGWKTRGWRKKDGNPVLNDDLWKELDRLNGPDVRWRHVRGHRGNYLNERCDRIAVAFSAGREIELRAGRLSEMEDRGEIVDSIKDALSPSNKRSGRTGGRAGGGRKTPAAAYARKVYLFAYEGKLYRFDNWPACRAFSAGKPGYTKSCKSRAEEVQYAQAMGLPPRAVDEAVNNPQ